MQTHLSEGIILQTLDFKEFDQIVTVFTENEGVIKFIAKRGNSLKNKLKNSPLTRAEFVYTIGRSELYQLQEISIKDHYLGLRKDLNSLNLACALLKSVMETQMLHTPAPALYQLLLAFLKRIPKVTNHEAYLSSFRLKILEHEGVLDLDEERIFALEELGILKELVKTTSFAELDTFAVSKDLSAKVYVFFKETAR